MISKSVGKVDSTAKAGGSAQYIADFWPEDAYWAKFVRSTKARAKIKDIKIPDLPENYSIVTYRDVPGENKVHIVEEDMPVLAEDTVEYIGDPILMIVGPDRKVLDRIHDEIEIDYEELEPCLDPEKSDTAFFEYEFGKGDTEKAFKEADKVYEETFRTGLQEQGYLETQQMMAYEEDGVMTVRGSLQCPYYVVTALELALDRKEDRIRVIQDTMGGAFGGKEDYPSILGCQLAVAAEATGQAVRCAFSREEDIISTSKKHPSISKYKVAVKDGKVTAMDIDVIYNAGAYTTLSAVVLQRGLISSAGVYTMDNLHVHGTARKTNVVPNGAYRGFGASQTFFSVEMMMTHIAYDLGEDPLEFKMRHMAKKGDETSTQGKFHHYVPLKEMIDQVDDMADYRRKKKEYEHQTGRYRKGIGMSLSYHGCGFTGSGERDIIKAVASLKKHEDDRVEILTSITDMGQGAKTTFSKIVANELGLDYRDIINNNPDTAVVPDSGPTVASRSVMVVGELLRRCAVRLKEKWYSGEQIVVTEHFKEPDYVIPFDLETFTGDAYPAYAWGVHATEIEVDTLTGEHRILGSYGSFDVGTPMDRNIVIGQMEGGMMQCLGYASMEQMDYDENGFIRNHNFTDYTMPTALDVDHMDVDLYTVDYPEGPFGAKGAGELPAVGGAASYLEAVEQATGTKQNHIPFTAEDTFKAMGGSKYE